MPSWTDDGHGMVLLVEVRLVLVEVWVGVYIEMLIHGGVLARTPAQELESDINPWGGPRHDVLAQEHKSYEI
jgi:hypothetical protein